MSRFVGFRFLAVVSFSLWLVACQSTKPDPKLFTPSSEHLSREQVPAIQGNAGIPSVVSNVARIPKPSMGTKQDLYTVSVIQVPVKDVLFKLARDAGLDVDVYSEPNTLVTINAIDQPLDMIINRLNDQTDMRITIDGRRLVVREDTPYWVNYPVDYVNLDRYSQTSVMLANAVGRTNAQGGAAVTLGQPGSQPAVAAALQAGSNVAILNRSRNELWTTLGDGVMRVLKAMYPMLGDPAQNGQSANSSANASAASAGQASATSSAGVASGLANNLANSAGLPMPEQPLLNQATPAWPYPEGAPVSNYINLAREAGFIAVYAPRKGQIEVQKFIDQMMSGGRRQVMIEATIVEVELNDESQAGINWNALTSDGRVSIAQAFTGNNLVYDNLNSTGGVLNMQANAVGNNFSLGSTLKLLERFGNSKVLSSPKLVAINNQPSLLKVVKNIVYFTVQAQVTPATATSAATRAYTTTPNTVPIGLVMSILPSISDNDEITLVVRPTISTLSGSVADPNPDLGTTVNLVPIVQEREMESVLKLNDGQVAILGGLIQDTIADEDTGVPGLVSQPGLGYLFGQKNKAKRKSELVIFLKPVLVKHPDMQNGSFADKQNLLPVVVSGQTQ